MDRAVRFSLFALGTFIGSLFVLFATQSTDTGDDEAVLGKGGREIDALGEEVAQLRAELAWRGATATADEDSQEPDWGELEIREREQGERRAAAITAVAARETVDPDWGPATERQIADQFAAHGPPDATLLSVTCKSTLCIAEMETSSRKKSTGQLAWRAFFGLSRGFVLHRESTPDRGFRSVVFLAREGHRLPHEIDLN
jgi:hypothetical protein